MLVTNLTQVDQEWTSVMNNELRLPADNNADEISIQNHELIDQNEPTHDILTYSILYLSIEEFHQTLV